VHSCLAQDFFAISNYNVVDIVGGSKSREPLLNAVGFGDVEKAAFWPTEDAREVLDGLAFGGGVDDTEHFFQMRLNELP
jgi:hypothetical protein